MPFSIRNSFRTFIHKIVNSRQEIAKIMGLVFLLFFVISGLGFLLWYLGNTTCRYEREQEHRRTGQPIKKGPCTVGNWLDYFGLSWFVYEEIKVVLEIIIDQISTGTDKAQLVSKNLFKNWKIECRKAHFWVSCQNID